MDLQQHGAFASCLDCQDNSELVSILFGALDYTKTKIPLFEDE